jgi:serine phosphatase RsbU (regulator of sigma subunit)
MISTQPESPALTRIPQRVDLEQLPGLDLHAQYFARRTGGDFFDALVTGTRMVFILSDIAGRREETDPIAAEMQITFREKAAEFFSASDTNVMDATSQLVHEVNNALFRAANGVRFAPTFFGCYDLALGVLAYINAGGQPALIRDSDGTRILGNVSVPTGLFTHLTYDASMHAFEPGSKLLLVTKGVVESRRGGTQFGVDRVLQILKNSTTDSAAELCKATLQASYDFKKLPWYSIQKSKQNEAPEDLTALALVRPVRPA